MPIYESEEKKICSVDFGNGAILNIKMKEDFDSVDRVRNFLAATKKTAAARENISKLEEKQLGVSLEDFNKVQAEIDRWQKQIPDEIGMTVNLIHDFGESWDYYPNHDAELKGEPYPFTTENIARFSANRINKIATAIMKMVGIGGEEEADPKQQSSESAKLSTSALTVQ